MMKLSQMKKKLKLSGNKTLWERRTAIILLVFNIFLFMKGISATYTATYLAIYNPELVEHYMNSFQILPILYFIPLILLSIPLFYNNKITKITDLLGLGLLGVITITLLFF